MANDCKCIMNSAKTTFNERVLVYTDVSFPIFALYPFHISDSLFSSQNGYVFFPTFHFC